MRIARVSFIALSFLLSAGIASAGLFSRKKPTELAVRTTAYTHSEADHRKYGRKTAAGGTLKYGKNYSSAAADWSKFPLGTKFKIDGMNTTFVVDDYGSALVGTETIDIYKPSRSAMNQWGVKHVDIKILEFGDFEKSREILEQRTKYGHVRKMLAGIDKNPGPKRQKRSNSAPKKASPVPVPPEAGRNSTKLFAFASPVRKPASKRAPAPVPAPLIPGATQSEAHPAETVSPPRPSLRAPALRKVRPLQLASITRSISPEESVNVALPAEDKPATRPNQWRRRAFRPLTVGANG